jgi:NAD+ kinase
VLKRVVILHHPEQAPAAALGADIAAELGKHCIEASVASVWGADAGDHISHASVVICIGGDGTVLRAARLTIPHAVPLLGINMGRLGFLTDMTPSDFFIQFERVLAEDWRIEERMMVRADFANGGGSSTFHGLNDIVVSRQSSGRPIYVDLRVDRAEVANYRCDGIIVSTPTGSTGYSLSAGGPILPPDEQHLIVTPVSAHMALSRSLVLHRESVIELRITSDHGAVLSVDGQDDLTLHSGAAVSVRVSEHITRFVRFRDPSSFYGELAEKLELQLSSAMRPASRA